MSEVANAPVEQTDAERRIAAFDLELGALIAKHRVMPVPVLSVTKGGIFPVMQYLDKDEADKKANVVSPHVAPIKA